MSPHELRFEILRLLQAEGPMDADGLAERIGVARPFVRHQLAILSCDCGGFPALIAALGDGRVDLTPVPA